MTEYPNNIEIRRWGQSQSWGHKISDRGELPRPLILAWNKAHPDRPYVRREAYHGTQGGYTKHNCRCDRCTEAEFAYQRIAHRERYREQHDVDPDNYRVH